MDSFVERLARQALGGESPETSEDIQVLRQTFQGAIADLADEFEFREKSVGRYEAVSRMTYLPSFMLLFFHNIRALIFSLFRELTIGCCRFFQNIIVIFQRCAKAESVFRQHAAQLLTQQKDARSKYKHAQREVDHIVATVK